MRGGVRAGAQLALSLAAILVLAAPAAPAPTATAIVLLADTTAPANYSMNSEPAYTNGTANTVSWSAGDDPGNSTPIEYYAQASRLLNFSTVDASSGWILATSHTFSGLQNGIQYYYRVRARDSSGNVGGFSAAETSTQDDAPPPSPVIGAEPSFTVGTSNTVAWGTSTDAGVGGVQYYAEASASSTFASIFGNSGWVGGTSTTFSGLTSATTYYFHVKARDGFGHESAWSSVVFSTQDADAPSLPAINAEPSYTVGTSNSISWSTATDGGVGGVQYQLQFSASSTFASGVVSSPWQAATSFTATPLAGGTTYYYRVSSRDAFSQQSAFSAIVSSTQDSAAPTTPVITAEPAFTNGTTNTVAWSTSTDAGSGGVQYWVDQSRSNTFATIEDSSGWVTLTSFAFTKLDDGVTYYYRVKARDAVDLETVFSGTASSTQDASAPTTPVLAPEPTFTAGTSNFIVWGSSTDGGIGGVQYMAEMSTSSTFSTINANSGWTAFTFAFFSSLTDGTTYHYRVKARDGFGHETGYSSVTSSTQDNSAPTVPLIDAEPAFTVGASNLVSWQASTDTGSGGVQYQFQYSTSSTFASGVITGALQSALSFNATPLADGTAYYYRVRARDALALFSAFSAIASSTQDNTRPSTPAITAEPSFTNGTTNTIAWGASADTTSGGVQYWVESSRSSTFTTVEDSSGWISALSFTFTKLDDGTTYFYRVKARDAVLLETPFSSTTSSTQDNAPPAVPLVNPEPSWTPGTSNTISWGAARDNGVGSVTYFAERSTSPIFATVAATVGWTAATSATFASLSDGTVYYYRVKARDGFSRESEFSSIVSSGQDNAAPSAPALAAEPAFTAGTSNTVTWSASFDTGIGGIVYDLQYANNAAFTGATTVFSLTSTTYTATGLSNGSTYYFRVRSRDAFGFASSFSASVSSLQDNAAPPAPAMSSEPGFTAGTSNTVSWSAVVDAGVGGVQYNVQASRSPSFATMEAESGWIAATSYTFTRLEDATLYYFRVASRDAFLFQSAFSGTVSSTQDNSPPAVPVLNPEPTFTAGTSNSLAWAGGADAGVGGVTYNLQYSNNAGFSGGVTVLLTGVASPTTVTGLTSGVTYFFRVRALDSFLFTSAWSNVEYSTQDGAAPSVPSITAEPSFTPGSSNAIAWSASSDGGIGGVQYWAEYAATSTFATVLGNSGWTSQTSATFFGLSDGTRYYFRVKARDAFLQESAFSASANSQQDASPPSVPGTSALSPFSPGNVLTFVWSASSDAGVGGVEYEAQMAAGAGFSPVLASSGWASATSFTYSGLSDGQAYHFRVRARDAFSNTGGFSTVRSTTMDASAPALPLLTPLPQFTPGTTNVISWTASSDAGVGGVQHQVQYSTSPAFPPVGTVTTSWGVSSPYTLSGLSDGTTYYYRVRARDAFLYTSAWSSVERSTQDASPPDVPISTGLPPVIDGPATPYSWYPTTDAGVGGIEYQAQVARDPFFSTIVETSPWVSENFYLFAGLNDATVYYYRVRARDAFGFVSLWSTFDAALTDYLPPPAPVMNSLPAYSRGLSATVSWRTVVDAGVGGVQYQVLAFLSTDTSNPFAASPWTADTWQLVGALPEAQLVYFAVHARDALGHVSPLSPLVSTTPDNSPPPVPTLSALPPYTNGLSLAVGWSAVADGGVGGVLYRVQVSYDPAFAVGVVDSGWVSGQTFTATALQDGRLYFARVKAQDAFQFETAWSALERTQMDASPPAVPSLSPLPLFTAGSAVAISWSAVADAGVGAVSYNAQVSTATDFSVILTESGWTGQNEWAFSGLSDAVRHYFRVSARDAFLYVSPYSSVVWTTLDQSPPSTPELLVLSAYTAGLQLTVRWNTVADLGIGGVEYAVESSGDPSFLSGAVSSGWITATQYTFAGLADGGQYFFRTHARDAFGYTSAWSQVRNSTMDDSPPSLTLDQISVTTNMDAVELTGTAQDAVSDVFEVLFSADGGASWLTAGGTNSWSAFVSGLVEGETTVLLKARDLVGLESPVARVAITVDETAPIVAFQSPSNGSVLTGLVGVYAVIADPNFDSFKLQQRAAGRANFTDIVTNGTVARGDNFLGLWDTRTLQNGMYELRLTARDSLDQVTQRAILVRLLNSDLAVSYSDLSISNREPTRGDRVNVTAVVTNFGTAPAENVTVRVKDNGATLFEQAGITVAPHASFTVDIPYNVNQSGAHSFTLEVSYPEGALDTGLSTSAVVVAKEPPVPEPKPFLVEAAGFLGLLSLIALAALAGWAFVQIQRLKRGAGAAPAYAGAFPDEAVDVEWESDEFL